MDPVSLVVAAVVAGAAAGAQNTADSAIRDAYLGLKSLLKRRFGRGDDASDALDHAEDIVGQSPDGHLPEADAAALTEELSATPSATDAEVVAAAQRVLGLTDPQATRAGKYRVTLSDSKGVVIGDGATVTMNFDGH